MKTQEEMQKHQVVVIHGGETFRTQKEYLSWLKKTPIDLADYMGSKNGWKDTLQDKLGEEFQVIRPIMPNDFNAQYPEWQIWFEKFIPHLAGEVILVGHSLGGIFLAKYLSENKYPKKIKGVFLVAPPYDDRDMDYPLGSFNLPDKLNLQTKNATIYHSTDDEVVPVKELEKYSIALANVKVVQFTDRGHFLQAEFPEIVEDIKTLAQSYE